MGRSKFTFPVPGRKQKPPFGPIVSGPMSKAQKILGTAEINIDAPRQWDNASTSGISVSVSESTATYNPSERSRVQQQSEEKAPAGNHRRNNSQWEQESEIVPAYLTNRFSQLNTDAGPRDFTETSSLTRRGSSSTITSWYDKSKMPLSISQQTSSSSMAKGLPQKANELLDIEGNSNTVAPLALKPKKKPSRLDLGPLLSRHKHGSLKSLREGNQGNQAPSSDYDARSPSLASVTSPKSTPPPIQQRTERKLVRRSTYERMVENLSSGRPRTGSSSRRGANDISPLPNLYEHYEQMSFDQVLGHDGPLAKPDQPMANAVPTPLRSPPLTEPRKSASVLRPGIRPHQAHAAAPAAKPAPRTSPEIASSAIQQGTLPDRDCASSVSSRYTKTSKASKRTSRSITGSDLMERSVLSLSSDSEEDDAFPDTFSSKFTGESQSSDTGSLAPSSLRSNRSREAPSLASRKSVKHASFAPTNTYLTIPSKSPPSKAPSPNSRMSSLPATRYQPPAPSNRSSMYSTKSTSTTNSGSDRHVRPEYAAQEARATPQKPVQQPQIKPERVVEPPRRMLSTKSSTHSVDQPTPPLSPTSIESFTTSTESIEANGGSDSRFMAVTRQEEMLLAALRMKRARMRESLVSEYEEETQYGSSYHHQRNSSQGTIKEMQWPEPPQMLRHQTSTNSNSTIKAGSRSSEARPGSLVGSRNHSRSNSRRLDIQSSSSRPGSMPSSRTGSLRRARPSLEVPAAEAKHERILLYLDRPVGNVSSMDFAEPSPDLSDFMDFDNGSDEEDELSSDPSLYRHRLQGFGFPNKGRGRMLRTSEPGRHDSSPLRPRNSAELAEQVRVVESESDIEPVAGIPRPDSPVSPEGTLPLPNHRLSSKKAVRLSAVGNAGVEAGWWDDDG
ncbi:hypothetical protein CkaCkLH20_01620 [Colletotrichum karsti]|uniref:Uncharacterized protein n=1 Tax=Colletotrichum karsti TaxID=1095194 RepID=A0A9P6ID04_9PEZI|nr:uncharacterized protein CkaCkLH20_01620 [Colletotrichum karsti]KAF9880578.1 hypothetical protein CkaCkLH20_01620 [Colletotrichum karsti]